MTLSSGDAGLTLLADGGPAQSFTFTPGLPTGAGFDVTVSGQPSPLYCAVADAGGTLSGADVTDIAVSCGCDAGAFCSGICADTTSDPNNCNGCGNVCASGTCGSAIGASLDITPNGWTLNRPDGGPYISDAGELVLTSGATNQEGSIVYDDPLQGDSFTVSFELRITPPASGPPADGVGFMLQTNGPTALGAAGGGLGMAGLTGFGVEFDTYDNRDCSDASANHVGIDDLTACNADNTPTSLAVTGDLSTLSPALVLADGAWHAIRIQMVSGTLSVSADGNQLLSGVDLVAAGFNPAAGYYFGFSAATGASISTQEIKAVAVTFPAPQCL